MVIVIFSTCAQAIFAKRQARRRFTHAPEFAGMIKTILQISLSLLPYSKGARPLRGYTICKHMFRCSVTNSPDRTLTQTPMPFCLLMFFSLN